MVSIADKIGRPSKADSYAGVTTVKTARLANESVMAAFDVSKYPVDTPVFFVTYQKSIDPSTNVVTIINQKSWKALVNPDNNTLTNLVIAPGYTDTGNAVGDFIEPIATSFWGNSLVDALLTSINPDGTLKTSAVQQALNITGTVPPDYISLATAPVGVTHFGQRSYRLPFLGVDYTDRLQPGTRLRTVRNTAAPVNATILNGVNQYWNNTSPQKFIFTNNFVISGWIKLSSYQAETLISRFNGTSGWMLVIEASGQVTLRAYNGGSANVSQVSSIQSIPLNRWVHIAAQHDMATFTSSPTTSYIMIDGVDVPVTLTRGGTNPTALAQAGNLEIGTQNGGVTPYAGRIAQLAVFGTKVTQSTIQSYINQGITGTEPNLLSAWSFNGNANDLNTTTPNNLTSNGGVTALGADSPFGQQANGSISSSVDYAIVMSVTKVGSDTIVIAQTPEGCTIATSSGITVSYSSASKPFGFPSDRSKWLITTLSKIQYQSSTVLTNGYANVAGLRMTLPAGAWRMSYGAQMIWTNGANITYTNTLVGLSTSPSSWTTDLELSKSVTTVTSTANVQINTHVTRECFYTISSGALLYFVQQALGNNQVIYVDGTIEPFLITAENALL